MTKRRRGVGVDQQEQGSLFPGVAASTPRRYRPWREIPVVTPSADEDGLERLLELHLDLLGRNMQLRRALESNGVPVDLPELRSFDDAEAPLLASLMRLRRGGVEPGEVGAIAASVRETIGTLEHCRQAVLQVLGDDLAHSVLASEPRMRAKRVDVLDKVVKLELATAEETGEVFEFVYELPGADEATDPDDEGR